MQVLIDEDKRALGVTPDNIEWSYPDPRWTIVHVSDEAEILLGQHDYIDYVWDGTTFIYEPKHYD